MPKIRFFFKDKQIGESYIMETSDQTARDKVARGILSDIEYKIYDKFIITDDDGRNPRTAILTPYFQDKQGRIWKANWADDV